LFLEISARHIEKVGQRQTKLRPEEVEQHPRVKYEIRSGWPQIKPIAHDGIGIFSTETRLIGDFLDLLVRKSNPGSCFQIYNDFTRTPFGHPVASDRAADGEISALNLKLPIMKMSPKLGDKRDNWQHLTPILSQDMAATFLNVSHFIAMVSMSRTRGKVHGVHRLRILERNQSGATRLF
jgi:hypothetical protein